MPAPDMVIRSQPGANSSSAAALPVPVPSAPEPSWGRRVAIAAVVVVLVGAAGAAAYLHRDTLLGYADKIAARLPSELRLFRLHSRAQPSGPDDRARAPTSEPPQTAMPVTTTPAAEASAPSQPQAVPKPDTAPAPARLEVDLSMSKIELVDGRYVVHGEIANVGGSPGTTSKLIVTYKKGDDVLGKRTYPLVLGPIAAGDRLSFSQTLDNPPAGATDIVPSIE